METLSREQLLKLLSIIIVLSLIAFIATRRAEEPSPEVPAQVTETVVSASDWTQGDTQAQTTLVYYFDLQCPACAEFDDELEQALQNNPTNFQIVYRHFPLEGTHPNAMAASQAVEAAGTQGKFFPMYKLLVQNQSAWAGADDPTALFISYAKSLNLNTATLTQAMNSQKVKDKIAADQALGKAQGVVSVPDFVLNNQNLPHPDSFEAFQQTISAAVNQAQ